MNQQANVESIQAIADFHAALVEFDRQTRDLLQTLELEVRRAIDWIEHDRTRYWPQQMRRATDAVQEARINLDAAQISVRPNDSRPCYEQKKLLENARRRLGICERKVELVKKWRRTLAHAHEELQGRLGTTYQYMDSDIAKAVAALERMVAALDKYAERGTPSAAPVPAGDADEASAEGNPT
jgi:hypothetical protein